VGVATIVTAQVSTRGDGSGDEVAASVGWDSVKVYTGSYLRVKAEFEICLASLADIVVVLAAQTVGNFAVGDLTIVSISSIAFCDVKYIHASECGHIEEVVRQLITSLANVYVGRTFQTAYPSAFLNVKSVNIRAPAHWEARFILAHFGCFVQIESLRVITQLA